MTIFDEKTDTNPKHFWLRGEKPGDTVEFDEELGLWNVYGYAESRDILADPKTFSSNSMVLLQNTAAAEEETRAAAQLFEGDLTQLDPPDHRKLRALVSSAFTPKVVADLEPRIAELAAGLLDEAGGDRTELVNALAYPLPVIVIADLLGVPAGDRDMFRGWVDAMINNKNEISLKELTDEQQQDLRVQLDYARQMADYLREHVRDRRRHPRADLLTKLVGAEIDGERLTENEVINFANLLLFAGHITTTLLIGNTTLCLDANPDGAAAVRADRSLVPSAIEESLRLLTPFAATLRRTTTEVTVAGRRIAAEQGLVVWLGAANRDGRQFPNPNGFDPARDPNPHLAFGRGIHFCLGAPLARLEGRIVMNLLLDRYPTLRTDPDNPPTLLRASDMTGVSTLPVLLR